MSEIEYMKECMARDLVVMLVDEQKMSTARSVRRPIPIRNLRQTKGHKVRSLFPKSRLRLRILAQGDIDRQDVTKEYTKNVLR